MTPFLFLLTFLGGAATALWAFGGRDPEAPPTPTESTTDRPGIEPRALYDWSRHG